MKLRPLAMLLVLCLLGCATEKYARLPNDSPEVRHSKNVHRVLAGIFTLGIVPINLSKKEGRIARSWQSYEAGVAFTKALGEARTLQALIDGLRSVPRCESTGNTEKACTWSSDTRVYGSSGVMFFGLFFPRFETTTVLRGGTLFEVICTVPVDGSERAVGSCIHSTRAGMQREGYFLVCRQRHSIYCPPDVPFELDRYAPL